MSRVKRPFQLGSLMPGRYVKTKLHSKKLDTLVTNHPGVSFEGDTAAWCNMRYMIKAVNIKAMTVELCYAIANTCSQINITWPIAGLAPAFGIQI